VQSSKEATSGLQILDVDYGSRRGADAVDRVRAARLKAVRFAHASLSLDGFSLSPVSEQNAAQFVAGLIDLEEFVRRGKIGV
jgi:hypothetical protein